MLPEHPDTLRPPWRWLALELRAYAEYRKMPASGHLDHWPQGFGRPILVIPGFGQSASTTAPLRDCLKRQNFYAYDWGLGQNRGLQSGMTSALLTTIETLQKEHHQPVTLVGWSLGGIIARELARKAPESIARVITLGSPIAGPQSTTVQSLFAFISGKANRGDGFDQKRYLAPPVPCTAIFTRQDGIVNWRASLEPAARQSENIEVQGSHLGMGFNPQVWHAICHRASPDTEHLPYATA